MIASDGEYRMKNPVIKVIIPARLKSSRFPAKPLAEILGKSMIERTYMQCVKATDRESVFVATDAKEIEQHCQERGMNVVMTSEHCLTGTDRVAQVAEQINADVYINVQGDEPLIDPQDIKKVLSMAEEYPDRIINGYAAISDEATWRSLSVPKVVVSEHDELIYMSRTPIPGNKSNTFIKGWRQVCVYAFPQKVLSLFSAREHKSELEEIEDLEILRFLEMGHKVKMVQLSDTSIAVDHPEDIEKVIKRLKAQ